MPSTQLASGPERSNALRRAIARILGVSITSALLTCSSLNVAADEEWQRAVTAVESALRTGDYSNAQRRLAAVRQRVQTFSPNDWRRTGTEFLTARVHLTSEDYARAQSAFAAAQKNYTKLFGARSATAVRALSGSGRAFYGLGDLARAQASFEQALKLAAGRVEGLEATLGLAEMQLQSGALDAAGQRLSNAQQAYKSSPAQLLAWLHDLSAQVALAKGDRAGAREHLKLATDVISDPNSTQLARISFMYAQMHLRWDEPLAALERLKQTTSQLESAGSREHPDLARAFLAIATANNTLMRTREADAALATADSISQRAVTVRHPLRTRVKLAQALSLVDQGNFKAAIERLNIFLKDDAAPKTAEQSLSAHTGLAQALFARGDTGTALKTVQLAVTGLKQIDAAQMRLSIGLPLITLLVDMEQLDDARDVGASLRAALANSRADHPLSLDVQIALLGLATTPAELADAAASATALVERAGSTYPDGGIGLATALNAGAAIAIKIGQPADALSYLTEAHAQTKRGAPGSLLVARSNWRLAAAQFNAGNISEAQTLANAALAQARKLLPNRHPELATFQLLTGQMQLQAGRLQEAAAAANAAVTLSRNAADSGPQLARAHLLLGAISLNRGRLTQANNELQKARAALQTRANSSAVQPLQMQIAATESRIGMLTGNAQSALDALGARAPEVPQARFIWHLARAQALGAMDHRNQAATELESALSWLRDNAPRNATYVAQVEQQLALARLELGDYKAADELQREATRKLRDSRGANHPLTIAAGRTLAGIQRQSAQLQDATQSLDEALRSARTIYPADHPSLVPLQVEAGLQLQAAGQFAEAAQALAQAQQSLEKSLSSEHPDVSAIASLRAEIMQRLGRYGDVDSLLKRTGANLKRTLGADHPRVIHNELANARLLIARGAYADAERQLEYTRKTHSNILKNNARLASQLDDTELQITRALQDWRRTSAIAQRQLQRNPRIDQSLNATSALALALMSSGDHAEARALLERALDTALDSLGTGHPLLYVATTTLAKVKAASGGANSAISDLRNAIDTTRSRAPNDPGISALVASLATVQLQQGLAADAMASVADAIDAASARLGDEHASTATLLRIKASILAAKADYAQAIQALTKLRTVQERTLGYQHPMLGYSAAQLAGVFIDAGELSAAAPVLTRARSIARRGTGAVGYTLTMAQARLAAATGRMEPAAKTYQDAAAQAASLWGADHPSILDALLGQLKVALTRARVGEAKELLARARALRTGRELPASSRAKLLQAQASIAVARREFVEADQSIVSARGILEQTFGLGHPRLGALLSQYGTELLAAGKAAEASVVLEQADAAMATTLDQSHPQQITLRLTQVRALLKSGRANEANALFERLSAVDAQRGTLALSIKQLEGELRLANGDAPTAVGILEQVVADSEQIYGTKHPLYAERVVTLAAGLISVDSVSTAKPLLRRALAIQEEAFGAQSAVVANTLGYLGAAALATNDPGSATKLLQRQLSILESSFGIDDPRLGATLINIGQLFERAGALKKAEEMLRRGLAISTGRYGNDHIIPAIDKARLAAVLIRTGNDQQAESLLTEALQVMEARLSSDDPILAQNRKSLAVLKLASGDYPGAEQLVQQAGKG